MRLSGFDNLDNAALPANRPPLNGAQQTLKTLLSVVMPIDKEVLTQARDPHTGSFLTAKPRGSTELSDEAFISALRLRLGLEQIPAGFRCQTHNYDFDTYGRHALSCQNFQGAVNARHDYVGDAILDQYARCTFLDHTAELTLKRCADESTASAPPLVTDEVFREQYASGRNVPGDIGVCLTRDAHTKTYYEINVVNCLTD